MKGGNKMEYLILRRKVIETDDKWRTEIQLCTVPKKNHAPQLRFCFYSRQKRKNGKPFWNLVPRPPAFDIELSQKIVDAVEELTLLYTAVGDAIEANK